MTSNWPDGWITATLKDAGLPVNDFTMSVLSAWNRSTPILPYTNNPLGMPAVKGKTLELMQTGYAMFATMGLFRVQFASFLNGTQGSTLHDALALSESSPKAYRAIHSLPWPANSSETDWPSVLLDMTSQSYRDKVATVSDPADRKTSGTYGSQTAFGSIAGASARGAAQTVTAIQQATKAVTMMTGRIG